jgi:hypothetical protein
MHVFPFVFFPIKKHKDTMGKTNATSQLLNSFTIGKISIIFNTKGPWNIFAIITRQKFGLFMESHQSFYSISYSIV